jgi:S-adenosylmethionine:tRNA ribosyltransferase-isomerase
MTAVSGVIDFLLPDELVAHEPAEERGLSRDEVKLMVSRVSDDLIVNTGFFRIPDFLESGDVLVVNTSATINAAFPAIRETLDGIKRRVTLHLSTPLADGQWVIELRRNGGKGTTPLLDAECGETIELPGNATAILDRPLVPGEFPGAKVRLWIADIDLPVDLFTYSDRYGSPITYSHVGRPWPLSSYQTIFSKERGSVEMPSAGRAFTAETVERLRQKGVEIAPVLLHTGVSSLESDELPYPEFYRVGASTANAVNAARANGGRIVAVGTTVVRALETVARADGTISSGEGWTDIVVTPESGVRAVDGILTGLHDPRATHLMMLGAFASSDHLSLAYANAIDEGYLWHEFGDLHLIMP